MRMSVFLLVALVSQRVGAATIDFEDLSLNSNSYFSGPMLDATVIAGLFGPQDVGVFTSGGAEFGNVYDATFGSWSGFAYSNMTDTTTAGFTNQYSAYSGTGAQPGTDNYAIANGYLDQVANESQSVPFNPNDPLQLAQLPNLSIPQGYEIQSIDVTNTTYAALSMLNGDSFARRFGGPSGNDPDFFKLTVYGTDRAGQTLPNSVDYYLADYRFANNTLDYVVNDWKSVSLASLGAASHLYFNLASSDSGDFGINTPSYFALDNIQITPVPEPSSLVLLFTALAGLGLVVRRSGC